MSDRDIRVYLDHNATAPLRPEARAAMLAALGSSGNASSIHREGRAARAGIEGARRAVAALVGAGADGVTFTSGATEGAALCLAPTLAWDGGTADRLVLGATEHPAVQHGHRFAPGDVTVAPVDRHGVIDLGALAAVLRRPGRALVALQAANGETGVVQPIAAVAALVHAAGGRLVCDAAQAAGRMPIDTSTPRADVLILSGHKLGGPQGSGAVIVLRDGLVVGAPLLRGGGQERGLRGGTENRAAIEGFGAAAAVAGSACELARVAALRDRLEAGLRGLAPDVVIFGEGTPRLPNTSAFAVPGLANETALIALDLDGIAVSTGSACSSGKVSRSGVLEAMGVDPHLRDGMLRVSLGWTSTDSDVDRFVDAFATIMHRMRRSPARAAA